MGTDCEEKMPVDFIRLRVIAEVERSERDADKGAVRYSVEDERMVAFGLEFILKS